MLQGPYRLHSQGDRFTLEDTDPAAEAFLRVHSYLELLGAGNLDHLNGAEHAAFDTYLAASTEFLVHLDLKTALGPKLSDIGLVGIHRVPYHTAVNAATAEYGHEHAPVVTPAMHQAILLDFIYKLQRLIVGELPAGAPGGSVLRSPIKLEAVNVVGMLTGHTQGSAALSAGAGADR